MMPATNTVKTAAPAAAEEEEDCGAHIHGEAAAAAVTVIDEINSTDDATDRTSSPEAEATIFYSTITAACDTAGREATGKRKRRVSQEDDILPKKDARILAMANENMNIRSNFWEEKSSSTASTIAGASTTQRVGQFTPQSLIFAQMPINVPFRLNHSLTYGSLLSSSYITKPGLLIPTYSYLHPMLPNQQYSHFHQTSPALGCYTDVSFPRRLPQLSNPTRTISDPNAALALAKATDVSKSKDDNNSVLLLANVALGYSDESSAGSAEDTPAKPSIKSVYLPKQGPKKRKKRSKKTKMKVSLALEDLPPQSKDDPNIITSRLYAMMERTNMSQKRLQKYDKKNGLPRSHAQTMIKSFRSRTQCQMVLKKL